MTAKQALRERVWDALEGSGAARFPFPPHGRIPNFAGARDAADRLAELDAWRRAETVKVNPDAPQLPVRRRALHDGKTVYVAVPRLADEDCFLELDPARIDPGDYDAAPALSNVDEFADRVGPDAVQSVDLVVSGSVAVTEDGARVGKGEGYSDLEFAVLREQGLVDDGTPTATTVHELQVVEDDVDVAAHDVPMDWICTPERRVGTNAPASKPTGIEWANLDEDEIEEIPILASMRTR